MTLRKLLPLAGTAFVVLIALSVVVGGSTPDAHAGAAKLASFYDAHRNREIAAAFALATSVLFLVLFASALVTTSRSVQAGARSVWELVVVAGSALTGAAVLVGATVHFALADGATHVSGNALQAFNLVDNNIWVAFNPALGVMMLGAAGSLLTAAAGRRWSGRSAFVLGIALFIPFVDFFAMLASGLWIVVMSVILYRASAEAPVAATPQATASAVTPEGAA